MLKILLAFCFLLAHASAFASPQFFVLPKDKAVGVLNQCTRKTPQGIEGFWTPKRSDVAKAERELQAFLDLKPPGSHRLTLQASNYKRQYVGFIKDGRRFLYGNFFSIDSSQKNEAREPVVACDGAWKYFGIVYSLDSLEFLDLQFNGMG